jgi:predicted nucleic acid-binding Zn ribbon protein
MKTGKLEINYGFLEKIESKTVAIYEYRCDEGHDVILERGMTEDEPEDLRCNNEPCTAGLKRVYTPPAIKFNGRGFFSTGG